MAGGIVFPDTDGRVSTTVTGKKIWAAAAAAGDVDEVAQRISSEKNWRKSYPGYVCELVDLGAASKETALNIAKGGLDCIAEEFAYVRADGERVPLSAAMAAPDPGAALYTGTIQGEAAAPSSLEIPPNSDDAQGALALLQHLAQAGTCEPEVYHSVAAVAALPSDALRSLLDDHVFVLLGGTSEMGPYLPLAKLGATVVAVSRRGKKLAALVRAAAATAAGSVVVPLSRAQTLEDTPEELADEAGADVLAQAPELAAWLVGLYPGRTMVIGSYIYLDGEAHVRAVVAMDAVLHAVVAARAKGKTAAMYLGSPATAHVISRDAWDDSRARFAGRSWLSSAMALPFGFAHNDRPLVGGGGADQVAVTDGQLNFQGQNYSLAKTIQYWRAVLLHEAGVTVSFNMAPPCRTFSVVHSAQAKAAIEGMAKFEPNLAFEPTFASGVMAALVLWDLTAQGKAAAAALSNPMSITAGNAFHGGNVRCAFKSDSLGVAAFLLGKAGV